MAKKKPNAGVENPPIVPCGQMTGSNYVALKPITKFFKPGEPPPVFLILRLDGDVAGGKKIACDAVNRLTLLIHSQDSSYINYWFSWAIHLDSIGHPAFWVLEKVTREHWSLRLQRNGDDVAIYELKSRKKPSFPIKLQRKQVDKKVFKTWPRTITISYGE